METVLNVPVEAASSECLYCKTTNSPCWRMGPDGTKSLCNACGNRFRRTVSKEKNQSKVRAGAEEMSPEAVLAGASDEDEPSWDEISEVAAKLTLLASRECIDSDDSSRKRKRSGSKSERSNKRRELFKLIEERVEAVCKEQAATDLQLELLHAQILRQNNERVAMANLVGQLQSQIGMLEQALAERDHKIEDLQTSVQLKTRLIASFASQGSWQV